MPPNKSPFSGRHCFCWARRIFAAFLILFSWARSARGAEPIDESKLPPPSMATVDFLRDFENHCIERRHPFLRMLLHMTDGQAVD